MNPEDQPPTDEERREAELLARALDGKPARAVDDALAAVSLLKASRQGELSELRARAVLSRVWPVRRWRGAWIGAAAAAAVALAFVAVRPQGPASLPPPGLALVRAQLAAARPASAGALGDLEQQRAVYRRELYGALRRAYGEKL
ncbi:MAG TPA: hypothetical protein VGH20_19800 [Myxococcales bacterium]|jgi:hypothetical protein